MSSVQESSRNIGWVAWAGTRAEVERIFELAERLCAGAKESDHKARMPRYDDAVDSAKAGWEKANDDLAKEKKALASLKKKAKDGQILDYSSSTLEETAKTVGALRKLASNID